MLAIFSKKDSLCKLKLLVQHGANVYAKDNAYGVNLIHYSVLILNLPALQYLLEYHQFDVNDAKLNGDTALDILRKEPISDDK